MSNSEIEQSGTVKGHLPNEASLSGRISNGLSLSGHISIGGAGDFVIKMTVEANGDNYTVTSCSATVEQIDAAFNAGKNIVLTVTPEDGVYYVLSLTNATPGVGYIFESFHSVYLLGATIYEGESAMFAMEQIPASAISYSNVALPNAGNVGDAIDALVPDSHNHNNKNILDKLSDSNGKLQYNGSDVGLKGEKGDTPIKGTDYWTATDKAEIVNDTLAALPTWTGGSY